MEIHTHSDVQSQNIGVNTLVWQFCVILPGAKIGRDCNICSHCFIENEVVIGDRVTIKNGVYLFDNLLIEDDVFIGPNVTFTNDPYPISSRVNKRSVSQFPLTKVARGASIGGGATILPGVTIGQGALIGAGAVVTRDVKPKTIVYGMRSKERGYV